MDKAKAAVSGFLGKAGHHDTTVHESVAPAVTRETVQEQKREERQVVRDHEVHQDHYHTTVQPVKDQEVLAEQHHHNAIGVEHRTHDHRDHGLTKQHLQQEAAQFRNESVRAPATSTTSTSMPEVAGEHVHHHVHEKIQPVIHKQTIEPHVTHTTVPIHETHYNAPEHHTATALPAVSIHEFQKQGGSLTGKNEEYHHFAGEPRNINQHLGGLQQTGSGNTSGLTGTGSHTGTGLTGSHTGTGLTGTHTGTGLTGTHTGTSGHHDSNIGSGTHNTNTTSTHKPSLLDKLNPKKDADGDGKAGFMK